MRASAYIIVVACALARAAHAEPAKPAPTQPAPAPSAPSAPSAGDEIAAQLESSLPPDLGVAQVYAPRSLDHVAASAILVEPLQDPRAGKPSVKVYVGPRRRVAWVPVTIARIVEVATLAHAVTAGTAITADDVVVERRAFAGLPAPLAQVIGATAAQDLDAGTPLGKHELILQPPSPRGTRVTIELVRGSVHVSGTGVLELAARIGEPVTVRIPISSTVVHGILTAPGVVTISSGPASLATTTSGEMP